MTDLVNQGKGDVLSIWGTNDNNKLREIRTLCNGNHIDFWNPTDLNKEFILEIIKIQNQK